MKRRALQKKRVELYKWLFGPEKFSGLSRNEPQVRTVNAPFLFSWKGFATGMFTRRKNCLFHLKLSAKPIEDKR